MCENPGYIYTDTGVRLELDLSELRARTSSQELPAVAADDPIPTAAVLFNLERTIED